MSISVNPPLLNHASECKTLEQLDVLSVGSSPDVDEGVFLADRKN